VYLFSNTIELGIILLYDLSSNLVYYLYIVVYNSTHIPELLFENTQDSLKTAYFELIIISDYIPFIEYS